MNLKSTLDNYLGKSVKFSEEDLGDGTKQVCDLETGDCYVVRERDGLIKYTVSYKNNLPDVAV